MIKERRNKLKKIALIAVLLLFCAATFAVASGSKEGGEDLSLTKIKDRGTFILGLDDSFPPYGFRDENQNIVGYDIDLAKAVCERIGVELICQPIDWNSKEQELNTEKIDCIWNGFTITPERLEALSFTEPYVDNSQVVVVKKDSKIKALADMNGKKLGLQAGSSAADALEGAEEFKKTIKEVVEFKDNLTALMDLEIGGVDGVLMDIGVAQQAITKNNKPFVILSESVASEQYGIGFRKGDIALRDAVQEALEEMVKDGTMTKIDMKWFNEEKSVIGK